MVTYCTSAFPLYSGGMSKKTDGRNKRISEAADQMYAALKLGNTFEVGASLSTDDDTTRAVLLLRKRHPDVITTMLQTKAIVLTLGREASVSEGAWGTLAKAGYFPDPKESTDMFLAQHAKFMRRNDMDPEQAARTALEEDRKRNAVSISSPSESEAATPAPTGGLVTT